MGSADPKNETRTAPDYWLGKFIFELQQADNAAAIGRIEDPFLTAIRSLTRFAPRCVRMTSKESSDASIRIYSAITLRVLVGVMPSSFADCKTGDAGRSPLMAELVGIFAASHAPRVIAPEVLTSESERGLHSAFNEIGRRLHALNPDALIVIAPDHWVNFYLDNFPAICIGVGPEHDGRPNRCWRTFRTRYCKVTRRLARSLPRRHCARTSNHQSHTASSSTMASVYRSGS